jgi:outer membrane protein OmpA-like peptidoglycan-associated protein
MLRALPLALVLCTSIVHADVSAGPSGPGEIDPATLRGLLGGAAAKATLRKLTFQPGKATLHPSAEPTLRAVSAALAGGALHLVVVVHTDARGARAWNRRLAQERAQAVCDWLATHGVAAERLHAVGAGEWMPIASNDTAEGRAQNRRVDLLGAAGAEAAATLVARHQPPSGEDL